MKFNLIETKEILDVEKEIGYELIVNERPSNLRLPKFYVSFENSDVMNDGVLIGSFGNGDTIDEALQNYCKEVSCKKIVFGVYTNSRDEITLPKLVHTKLINK